VLGTSDPAPSLVRRTRSRLRWYEAAPELVLLVGLALFTITEPHAAAAGFKSSKAVVIMAAVAFGWILARAVAVLAVRWPGVRLALFGVAALMILRVVVLPAYHDHTVIETLPPAGVVVPAAGPAVPAVPEAISTGSLRGIDHRAAGTVNLYRQGESHVVGLENFEIQPGPAYALYLVAGADRRDHDGGTRIEPLRGNRGTQFYDVSSGIDLTGGQWTALVWCETFDVPVANSTLMPL